MNTYIKHLLLIITLSIALPATSAFAVDQVYGWQAMSEQEQQEHRAKEQGKSLSDMPRNRHNMMDKHGSVGMGSGGGGGGR